MPKQVGLISIDLLTLAAVGAVGWWLSQRISPVEQSYRLGFEAGYREGREAQHLSVVPLRKAS